MAQVIQDNIKFGNVYKDGGIRIGDTLIQSTFNPNDETPSYNNFPIINAVDIDWNGVEVGDNKTINTTGELINWIKNNILSEEDKKYLEYLRQIISVIKDDNPISDEATYYWYAGIIIPTTANISNIATGRTNEKPYWDAQNIKAVNTSNNSSYLYYCFPTEWNIKILDSDKVTEMSLTYIASFTHNNIEYIVKRTGRTISSGASKQYYAQCH
jgi:hypothetical protein